MAAVAKDTDSSRHIVLYIYSHGCDAIGYPVRSFLPNAVYEKINTTMYYESPSPLCLNITSSTSIATLRQIFSLPLPYQERIARYMEHRRQNNKQRASLFPEQKVPSVYSTQEYELLKKRFVFSALQKEFFQQQQGHPPGVNRLYNFTRTEPLHSNFGIYVLYDSKENGTVGFHMDSIIRFDEETQQWQGNVESSVSLVHELYPTLLSKFKDGIYLTLSSLLYAMFEAVEDEHVVLSVIDSGCRRTCTRFTEKIMHPEETEFAEMIAENPELTRTPSHDESVHVPFGFPLGRKKSRRKKRCKRKKLLKEKKSRKI